MSPRTGDLPGLLLRLAVAAAGLGLAWLVLADYRSFRERRDQVLQTARQLGLLDAHPELERQIESDPDPEMAQLVVARRVLGEIFDPANQQRFADPEGTREAVSRLERARQMAAEVGSKRPTAWEAAMVEGAATYLIGSLERDPRWIREYRRWEAPLERATELAPAREEPRRFLAAAYLELWEVLSPAKKQRTRELLRTAFEDPTFFARLAGPWLETAATQREAYELFPDQAWVWKALAERYREQARWPDFAAARQREWLTLQREISASIAAARRHLAAGDGEGARVELEGVVSQAPPSRSFQALFEEAIALLPPGLLSGRLAPPLRGWLEWDLERCLYGGCRLEPSLVARLRAGLADLPPVTSARAALVAGDLAGALLLERRSGSYREEWAPYLLQKVDLLQQRAKGDEARAALEQVHRSWRDRPAFRVREAAVAAQRGEQRGDGPAEVAAAHRGRVLWDALDWESRPLALEMLCASSAGGAAVTLDVVDPQGGAIEVWWDGDLAAVAAIEAGSVVEPELPVDRGLHRLELRPYSRGVLLPGTVRLLP